MSTKGIGTPDNRELAFAIYREFGGRNIPKVIEEISRRHGLRITAQTLYAWKNQGGWDRRMAAADALRDETQEEGLGFEDRMFRALMERKRAYDRYFQERPIDNQAQYAYNSLVETLIKLSKTIRPEESANPEKTRAEIDEILAAEYGVRK